MRVFRVVVFFFAVWLRSSRSLPKWKRTSSVSVDLEESLHSFLLLLHRFRDDQCVVKLLLAYYRKFKSKKQQQQHRNLTRRDVNRISNTNSRRKHGSFGNLGVSYTTRVCECERERERENEITTIKSWVNSKVVNASRTHFMWIWGKKKKITRSKQNILLLLLKFVKISNFKIDLIKKKKQKVRLLFTSSGFFWVIFNAETGELVVCVCAHSSFKREKEKKNEHFVERDRFH